MSVEFWADDYETGDFLWYYMDIDKIIGPFGTEAEAREYCAKHMIDKHNSTLDNLTAWNVYEAKATTAVARQDWGNAQANAGLALAAIRDIARDINWPAETDDTLELVDSAILMTKIMIEATDRHAMELNAPTKPSYGEEDGTTRYWREFARDGSDWWYWSDATCLEPMGPFRSRDEAIRDHHNCRMESQDDD